MSNPAAPIPTMQQRILREITAALATKGLSYTATYAYSNVGTLYVFPDATSLAVKAVIPFKFEDDHCVLRCLPPNAVSPSGSTGNTFADCNVSYTDGKLSAAVEAIIEAALRYATAEPTKPRRQP